MLWTADGACSYKWGEYRVIFAVKFWTSWFYGKSPKKLGDGDSAKAEMRRCEVHANG